MVTVAEVPSVVDLDEAVRTALRMTADHLTGPVLGNAFDVNFGLSGMAKLASELREPRRKSGWASRFGDPATFGYATARLAECLTSAYTAPGGTRPLYAEFLEEASGLLDASHLRSAAEAIEASGAQWQAIAVTARAAAQEDPSAASVGDVFTELARHVDAAAEHELRAVELIRLAVPD
jgi:hypothetical protein